MKAPAWLPVASAVVEVIALWAALVSAWIAANDDQWDKATFFLIGGIFLIVTGRRDSR